MDVLTTCSRASESEASQTLAIVLSIVFSVYVGSAILLSSFQLYSITASATSGVPTVVGAQSSSNVSSNAAGRQEETLPLLGVNG